MRAEIASHDDLDVGQGGLERVLGWAKTFFAVELHELLAAPAGRRMLLHRGERAEIFAARWAPGGACRLRAQRDGRALLEVLAGAVWLERYLPDGASHRREIVLARRGERAYLPSGTLHRVESIWGAATLHVHVPSRAEGPAPALPPARPRAAALWGGCEGPSAGPDEAAPR